VGTVPFSATSPFMFFTVMFVASTLLLHPGSYPMAQAASHDI
jgi:hypothetical protein